MSCLHGWTNEEIRKHFCETIKSLEVCSACHSMVIIEPGVYGCEKLNEKKGDNNDGNYV